MDIRTSNLIRKIIHGLFILALISSLFLRKSIFSFIFVLILSLFPFAKNKTVICSLYGITFLISLGLCIAQIIVNIIFIYSFKTELDYTEESKGCNSTYDIYIFDQLGFAWFSCDPINTILIKVGSDIFIMSMSLIALLYNIAMAFPIESQVETDSPYPLHKKAIVVLLDAISCICVVLISILNPNITSYVYFYSIISYPIYKAFMYFKSQTFHTTISYFLTRKLFLIIFYFTANVYLVILYFSQFSIVKDFLSIDSSFSRILSLTLFSHVKDMKYNGTSAMILTLHLVLVASLYISIVLRTETNSILNSHEIQFQSSFIIFHGRLLFQRYCHVIAIIGVFVWVISFSSYTSFVILFIAIFPSILPFNANLKIFQLILLSIILFFLIILQFVCTFTYSFDYFLTNQDSSLIDFGVYSPGYTPYVLGLKYIVFVVTVLGFIPILKYRKEWSAILDSVHPLPIVCENCEIISHESWLLRPNSLVQICTYLVTIFSRPIICIVPLIELYNNHASVHVCILIYLFLLLSVTQTKKNGWEVLQKIGLQITNVYIVGWIIVCYFFQVYSTLIPGINNPTTQTVLELLDLQVERDRFILRPYEWLLTALMVNRFLLSYYSSVLISNRFFASSAQENFQIPTPMGFVHFFKTILSLSSLVVVKGIKKVVMSRRLFIAIACFGVSLVRPSLLTFLTFFFSCLYATTHHRRFNQVISTILMLLSVVIVIVMTVYQNPHIPTVVINPIFHNYTQNESLIETGLTRSNAFQPILAFLCVIFMFSFFNSLSRYYTMPDTTETGNIRIQDLKSYIVHMIVHFLTYFGYELVVISAIVAAIKHGDIGSIIGIIFVALILLVSSDMCRLTSKQKSYLVFALDIYKYILVLIIMVRFALHVSSNFMTRWIKSQIKNEATYNIINHLFIQRTINSDKKYNLIYDYIHLFLLRVYTRDIIKNRLTNLNKRVEISDFTSCRNSFEFIHHGVFYHFIRVLFAVTFLVPFNNVCFINVIYMIVCGFIIVFQNKLYYSIKFKKYITYSCYFPILVLFTKLFFQLTCCLQVHLFKADRTLSRMLFNTSCPNAYMLSLTTALPDILILVVTLLQMKIFNSKAFNYTIINHYLYYLEAYNIAAIATRESELCRLDYERKLSDKQEKIKKSIEAIKENIAYDCGIPISKSKIDGLYGVTQSVFDKFYSHKDGQNKIFDDYNSKDVDDYIDDVSPRTPRLASPIIQHVNIEEESEKASWSKKIKEYLGWMSIIFSAFKRLKKKVQKMYVKENEREVKIRSIIESGRRIHLNEINRFTSTFSSDFQYKIEQNPIFIETIPVVESNSFYKYLKFVRILLGTIIHYLFRHTDFLVFLATVINQIYSSSFISMIVIITYFTYAAVSVPRPSPLYWRIISLVVLFSSFSRYITSISPLNNIITCSYPAYPTSTIIPKQGPLCIYQIFAIDGHNYSSIPDLLLLLAIQIHLASLHYRGMLSDTLKSTQTSVKTDEGFLIKTKNYIATFMKKYEKSICTMEHDYYSVIFITQAGQWILIAFYWNSFLGSSKIFGDITQIIKGSIIPVSFSLLITLQSLFILIDRFININRKRFYKLIYTTILVLLVHIFIFFIVPYKTQRKVTENTPVCVFYILYCLYFYFSFIPVRNGYSSKHVLPYSITRYHNYYSIIIIYCIIYFPFIYEVDTILRWFSSTTTLGFFQYIKIDEIFFNMHICKSFRKIMEKYNEPSGTPYYFPTKLFLTLLSLSIFFLAMILPLWIYTTGVTSTKSVLPSQIDLQISINGYSPLFESSVIKNKFKHYKTYKEINKIAEELDPTNQYQAKSTLLDYLEIGDIVHVEFQEPSFTTWSVSYPSKKMLIKDIEANLSEISFRLRFKIHRESVDLMNVFASEKIEGSFISNFSFNETDESESKKQLLSVINTPNSTVLLQNFASHTIRVESYKPIHYFQQITRNHVRDVCASKKEFIESTTNQPYDWWEFKVFSHSNNVSTNNCVNGTEENFAKLSFYFFIDFLKLNYIDFFSPSRNAIALYIILITSVSTFLKKFFLNTSHLIMYHEVPNPDYILNLCRYIYRARWSSDLELEEFFISILFYIYRSPETLIRVSKRPTQITPSESGRTIV